MDRLINSDIASAGGLIIGIILGSLVLDLFGAGEPATLQQTVAQAAPRAGASVTTTDGAISQR